MIAPPRPAQRVVARILAGMLLLWAGCRGGASPDQRPTPPAGLAPVTLGELVQLRLAVEGFDGIFDARSEEQDMLPMLVHAWATFYHRPDPAPTAEARYRFTEALCRARLPDLGPRRELLACMDQLRDALYQDLVAVTQAYRRTGRPDKMGEYRLSQLEKDFALRREGFAATRKLRADRRAATRLATVTRCALEQPRATVMAVGRTAVLLNGFPVLTAPEGLRAVPASEYDTLGSALESRLLEGSRVGRAAQELILAPDGQVPTEVLARVLALTARQGVLRVCLKVERKGPFRTPCCLPLRMGPPGVRPSRYLELGGSGVVLVDGAQRTPLPAGQPLPAGGPRSIRLTKGSTAAQLALLAETLGRQAKEGPEIFVGGVPATPRGEPATPRGEPAAPGNRSTAPGDAPVSPGRRPVTPGARPAPPPPAPATRPRRPAPPRPSLP